MKAITISQPYASLIASGEKWVENRTWPTNYRGPIAIHAGKGMQYLTKEELSKHPTGVVVAIAELTASIMLDEIRDRAATFRRNNLIVGSCKNWSEVSRHKHVEGPWCWILEDIKKIEPIIATGKQGLWVWNGEQEVCK